MDRTTRSLLLTLTLLLVLVLAFSALMGRMMGPGVGSPGAAGQGVFWPGMMPGHSWMWGFGMGLGGLVMLAFWGALIVGVVMLVRAFSGGSASGWQGTPLDILKRRYAAGQITREQYEQIRKDLDA